MRRDRFIEQFAEHLPYLRGIIQQTGLDHDNTNDVLSKCSESLLDNKSYFKVTPNKLKAFLRTAARFNARSYKKIEGMQKQVIARLTDPESTPRTVDRVFISTKVDIAPVQERECPFCFQANLNEYGACAMCHTIVPSHIRTQRNTIVMTEESLACQFDFDMPIDVQKAVARLTPFEQRVIKAVGLGNESLESFADDINVSKSSLVRTWVEAKVKLQDYLHEYGPQRLSKRGERAFRVALQRIEKTH